MRRVPVSEPIPEVRFPYNNGRLKECYQEAAHIKTFLAKGKIPDDNICTRFTLEISVIHKILKMRKIYVDQTGLGNPIIENCRDLNLPVTGLTLTPTTKEELLSNLRFYFEKKKNCTSRG